ncbi:cation diffusion facilitator family transporter [Methyloglobulus sp.]|uniref:cation diffusion facilitator family transporter n=1 Tax=Methyloglobulus sp. TaxID=2518622 RepID=UPI0039897E3F
MAHSNSTKAVLYAFSANLGIALAKTGAAVWTGSGSMLAEAIHSYADCGNQVLLLIGMRRSARNATRKHPMGYERESYIWSMMVAFILFSVGGVFAVHEGWERYLHPHAIENANIALLVLLIAVCMEAFSLKGAFSAMAEEKGVRSLWQWFKETHSSELMVVTGEDIAALLGLVIALVTLGLAVLTGNTAFDALGSMLIGLLLIAVAIVVGSEVHSLLIGESAEDIRVNVQAYLEAQPCVLRVLNLWAINHGNSVMVAIKAELKPDMTVLNAVNEINAMERQIKQTHSRVKWIFFEIDNED